jgi:hypothetical protein
MMSTSWIGTASESMEFMAPAQDVALATIARSLGVTYHISAARQCPGNGAKQLCYRDGSRSESHSQRQRRALSALVYAAQERTASVGRMLDLACVILTGPPVENRAFIDRGARCQQ